jgi:hypothetical protein
MEFRPKIGPRGRARLRRAFPHLIGLYAVIALLSSVRYFHRIPFADFNTRLNASIYIGLSWPIYWPMRLAMDTYRTFYAPRSKDVF